MTAKAAYTAGAVAARPGRPGSGPVRPARQRGRYGVQEHRTLLLRRAAGWPAQDTTMVELPDTHGGSSGGGPETELRRIRRTGVYALMDERILRSRVTRL